VTPLVEKEWLGRSTSGGGEDLPELVAEPPVA